MTEMIAYEIYIVTVLWGHTEDSRYYEGSDQACYMSLPAARNALEQRLRTDEVICKICAQQEPEAQSEDVFVLTGKNGWVLAKITSCPLFIPANSILSRQITSTVIPQHFADLFELYPAP